MTTPPEEIIAAAVAAACLSSCVKSKRGAAVYIPGSWGNKLIGTGFNGQPDPFVCKGQCIESCSRLAIHAEERAIRTAIATVSGVARVPLSALRVDLVHAKVIGGELVAGGGPSCWACSKTILDVGISGVWLYQEDKVTTTFENDTPSKLVIEPTGWRRYTARDFHLATAIACGMKEHIRHA